MNIVTYVLLVIYVGIAGMILLDMRGHRNGRLNRKVDRIISNEPFYDGNCPTSDRSPTSNLVGGPVLEERVAGSEGKSTEANTDSL